MIGATVHNSATDKSIREISPIAQYQLVEVVFPATPDTDLLVRHGLMVENPYDVYFQPVRQSTAGSVYEDVTPGRRAWASNYIVLRSDVASWTGTLMLTIMRDGATLGQ